MAAEDKSPVWKIVLKIAIAFGLLVVLPVYLSTDSFLTGLYEKAQKEGWKNADMVTFNIAGYYKFTLRRKRAAETYELFVNKWPQHQLTPDAVYETAATWREYAAEMEYTAKAGPETAAEREKIRTKAESWFTWFADNYPNHLKAETARRAAQQIRSGY